MQLRGTITKDSINSLRADFGIEDKYEAIYDVSVVAVEYETLGPKGEAIIASGAVYIPIKEDNERVIDIGQHGLTIKKYDVPSVIPSYGYFGFFGAAIGYAAIQLTMWVLVRQIILFIRSVKSKWQSFGGYGRWNDDLYL